VATTTLIATRRMTSVRVSMADEGSRGPDDGARTDDPIDTIGATDDP
jgi:hypothetical protein